MRKMSMVKSVLIALCVTASVAAAAVDAERARELYQRVTPSLVVVQYTYDGELGRREFNTTGIVLNHEGLIVLTSAVTPVQIPDEQMKEFKIIIPGDDEIELEAEMLGRDDRSNLSFVKATESHDWKPLVFKDVPVRVGDPLISIGLLPKEAGYKSYLTMPTVSAVLRGPVPQVLVSGEGLTAVGSPVFNAEGDAIGFVQALGSESPLLNDPRNPLRSVEDPPRTFVPARDFMISINDPPKSGERFRLPHVGVAQLSGLTKEVAEYFGLKNQPAVQIGEVIPEFPADKAGLRSGDIIVKVNGETLERGDEPQETPQIMTRKLLRMKVGEPVTFSVLRKKDEPPTDIVVTLEERPRQQNTAKRFYAEDLGFTARELVFEDTYTRRIPSDSKGVLVALIKPNSSAQTGKLQNGDLIKKLNQTDVESLDQFREQYEQFRKENPRDAVVLEVLRGVNTQIVRIEPPQ